MDDSELWDFAWDVVDDALQNVFRRFPEDVASRARVYRHVASQLQDIAADLMREYTDG